MSLRHKIDPGQYDVAIPLPSLRQSSVNLHSKRIESPCRRIYRCEGMAGTSSEYGLGTNTVDVGSLPGLYFENWGEKETGSQKDERKWSSIYSDPCGRFVIKP